MGTVITPGGRVGDDSSLDRSPKKNWVENRGGLPRYVRIVANGLMKNGHDRSTAIKLAIGAMKRWAHGGGNVTPKVQAAAAAALAQWEAMKATTASAEADMMDKIVETELPEDIDSFAATDEESTMILHDGLYEETVDDAQELASTLLASIPVKPPADWFENPNLDRPTPLTLLADGRVFGHIASWSTDHVGLPGRKPPRSPSNYAFFKTGVVATADGRDVPVGQLTYAGGHASLSADAGQAVKHYDDTASAFADVNAGEDRHGIWVAGAARPGITEEQIRTIRASAPSGDWRPINGNLEMIACCQVNAPGFPIARAMVASGEVQALVAAGARPLYELRQDEMIVNRLQEMSNRVTRMEDYISARGLLASGEVVTGSKVIAEVDALIAAAATSEEGRKKLADEGKALPDGSFPIPDVSHLKKAIRAIGRSKNPDAAKKLIIKRAKQLDASDLIPESWETGPDKDNDADDKAMAAAASMTPLQRMQSRRDDAKRMDILRRKESLSRSK